MGDKNKKEKDVDVPCGIKVHIRLKQTPETEKAATYNIFADGTQLQMPNTDARLELDRWYKFDHIYPAIASNKEVYRVSGYDLVENSLKGINTSIFAYGQTGSGKTRTLMSKDGVMSHMVSHLFHRIWKSVNDDVKVTFSYFQIHNERIYDLLNTDNTQECVIREDAQRGNYVENVACVMCETPMDVYELINVGRKALLVGESKGNRLSCRSHTICQIYIEKRKRSPRRNKRSMQEFSSSIPDPRGNHSGEIDFTNVPFNMRNFKQRLNTAVTRANDRKSPRSSKTQPNSPGNPRKQTSSTGDSRSGRTDSPDYSRSKTSPGSINIVRPRANSMKSRSSTRDTSPSMDLSRSSCLPLPRNNKGWDKHGHPTHPNQQPEDANIVTMVNTIGLANMKVLSDMYQSAMVVNGDKHLVPPFIQFNPEDFDGSESINGSSCMELETSRNGSSYAGNESSYIGNISSDGILLGEEAEDDEPIIYSKISIVDLAGSERLSDADRADVQRLKENQNVNLSLLELGNVISALTNGGKKKHVPYRNSVLTRLLQDTLGGNCKTKFILFVSTKLVDVNETKCTLEFGQKLTEVVNKPVLNLDVDWKIRYDELFKQFDAKKRGEEVIRSERQHHLESYAKEIEQAKSTVREQELLIVLLQTKMNTADMEQKKYNAKMNHLHKMIEDKDDLLATQDVEILKQKVELDLLTGKLAARNYLTDLCVVETEKFDVSTNTPIQDLTVVDTVDGSLRLINYADREEDSFETTGVFYLPGYKKCLDVIKFSDNNYSIAPYKSMDNFSESGFFIETKDASTNTDVKKRHVSTQASTWTPVVEEIAPPGTPIVVTFLQNPTQLVKQTSEATTNTPRTAIFDVTRVTIPNKDRRDSGYRGSLGGSTITPRMFECSTQTDLSVKYGNVDRVRSAILVELLSLQKLCQRSKMICDDPLFQSDMLTGYNESTEPESESICDGLSSVIAEIFNILPNMFNESSLTNESSQRPREFSASTNNYYTTTADMGYINRTTSLGLNSRNPRPKEQLIFLRDYLRNRKKSVEKELLTLAYDITNNKHMPRDTETVLEQKVIEGLIEKLSGRSLLPSSSLDELKKLLNIILCDHTITACLLALTQKQNLYYYNYSETDFDLMSNSTIESAEYNNNNNSNNNNNNSDYSYQKATEAWSDRIPRSPQSVATYDIDDKNDDKKDKTGLNRFFCMPFKSKKAYKNIRGEKPAQKEKYNSNV